MLLKRFMSIDDETGHLKQYILNMLRNNYLYIRDPSKMNDFFDGTTPIQGLNAIDNKKIIDTIMEYDKNRFIGNADKFIDRFEHNLIDFSNDYRIVCFFSDTENTHEELLWAHYADNNKGICIIYNEEELLSCLKEKFYNNQIEIYYNIINDKLDYEENIDFANYISLSKVTYGNKIPIVFKDMKVSGKFNTTSNFFIKSNAWRYENEVRLLVYKQNKFNNNNYYLKISDKCINEIRFGYYCNENLINEVCNILSGRGIKFSKMDIDDFGEKLKPVYYNFDEKYDCNKINYGIPIRDRLNSQMFKFETDILKDKVPYIKNLLKHIKEKQNISNDTGYKVSCDNIIEIIEMWIKYLSLFGFSREEVLNKLNKKYKEDGGFDENYVLKKIIFD